MAPENRPSQEETSSSNHPSSGAMLVLGSVSHEIRIPMISTDLEETSQISMLPMRKMPSATVCEVGVKVLVFRRRGVDVGGTPWKMNGWNLRFSPV